MTGTCFVVMGFGKKTDFETGRTLDLNMTYNYIIKPAVSAAGLRCIRADEIQHTGPIDVPMYEQLLNADVVVADLSTANLNAYYELGVRHALKRNTTIIICEDGWSPPPKQPTAKTFPFDVNHVIVQQYRHMGEGIDYAEVERFRKVLTETIHAIVNQPPRHPDSPVFTVLDRLTSPVLVDEKQELAEALAQSASAGDRKSNGEAEPENIKLYSELMEDVEKAKKEGNFEIAKSLLQLIRRKVKPKQPETEGVPQLPEDPYIIQQLALVTYKAKQGTLESEIAALREACDLLYMLNPATSNDTETLGLWGAVHKRLWDKAKDMVALDKAIRSYQRGFFLRNDYYNGINFAYLLNIRSAHALDLAKASVDTVASTPHLAAAIADFVQAERVRKEVLMICDEWIKASPVPDLNANEIAKEQYSTNKYWILVTKAEAWLGTGRTEDAEVSYQEAYAFARSPWMIESANEQRQKLELLLAASPLKYVATGE